MDSLMKNLYSTFQNLNKVPDTSVVYSHVLLLSPIVPPDSPSIKQSVLVVTRDRGHGRGGGHGGGRSTTICNLCGKIGHIEDTYWKKHERPQLANASNEEVEWAPSTSGGATISLEDFERFQQFQAMTTHASVPQITTLLACGGLAKNPLYVQEHADIVGCPIILPRENESVLLGAAILGSVAAMKYSNLRDAMKALNAPGQIIHPSKDVRVKKYHDAKYQIYRSLYEQQLSYRSIMKQALQ